MIRNRLLFAAVGLLGLLFAQSAQASTYCVNFAAGECSGTQKQKIQPALDAAADHAGRDTVKIAGGASYVAPEFGFHYDTDNPVDVVGVPMQRRSKLGRPKGAATLPVLSDNNELESVLMVYGDGSTVSNLEIDVTQVSAFGLEFLGKTASGLDIEGTGNPNGATGVFMTAGDLLNSTVHLPHSSTIGTTGVQVVTNDAVRILDSELSAGLALDIQCCDPTTVTRDQITGAVGMVVQNNPVAMRDSVVASKGVTAGDSPAGVEVSASPDPASLVVDGSTIYNQGTALYGVSAAGPNTAAVTLRNSIVRHFQLYDLQAGGAGTSISGDYNDYDSTAVASGATITPGAHDVNVTPGFVSAGNGNFHVASSSPLIDIGDPAGLAPGESQIDVYSSARLVSAHPGCPVRDIGAAEFKPSLVLHPTAIVSAPATAVVGEPVTFDASASCAPTNLLKITNYSWSFGDGFGDSGAQVSHAFGTTGIHTVRLTVRDSATYADTADVSVDVQPGPPPSHHFDFGKPKRDKKKGTAKLPVELPGQGKVKLEGKGLVKQSKAAPQSIHVDEAGTVKLLVKAKNNKKHKLKKHGKVTVKADVTFTPTGGTAKTKTKTLTLKRKH